MSVVIYATAFTDVPVNATYEQAVNSLAELGVITGDDTGKFNPDSTITRAEFCTIVYRLLSFDDDDTGKSTGFTDVPPDHWAARYVAYSVNAGLVGGYENGKFGPSDALTYEQAVKILVCAWGYKQEAEDAGGYPAGYVQVADRIGLLSGANTTATRSNIAVLVYNATMIPPYGVAIED